MTAPQQVNRCARGKRCRSAERDSNDTVVGAVADRPLCDPCEQAVARALDVAPRLYVKLRAATLIKGTAVRSEMVTASRNTPLPLNGQALGLAEDVWLLLVRWEDEVRRIARMSDRPLYGRREGRQVADAAKFLAAHLTAWIGAPLTPFILNTGHDPSTPAATEQSGVDAAIALLDWRSQVRNLPGMDKTAAKASRLYEQRCPACGVRAITHQAGDDLMQCQNCDATQPFMPTLPDEADYRMEETSVTHELTSDIADMSGA